jgi:predicted transcriptional regulator
LSRSKEPERKKIKMSDNIAASNYIELAADIVSAYVSNNSVPSSDLGTLINDVHSALIRVGGGTVEVPVEAPKPAIPVKKSVTPDYIVCLEDGKKFKSLKRHLRTTYNLTPEQYRAKWSLPHVYPMVAPSYAKARSELAKTMGLGQQRRKGGTPVESVVEAAAPAKPRRAAAKVSATSDEVTAPAKRGRTKKAV